MSYLVSSSMRGLIIAVGILSVTQACAAESTKTDMKTGMNAGMKMKAAAPEKVSFGEAGKAADVDRTITVTMKDVAYDIKHITVKNGETVRFIVVNKDDTDHEFTMGPAAAQAADRAEMAKESDAGNSMEMTVPNAVSVGPLETKTLIWKFKGPGKIEFDCNVPGHYEYGMTGTITITK